ncbi:MAG: alkaline phosphatase, partial [Kiritimatiellales bacterium]|nr:alkaline phosphatase [Kiritimatiellales bacterium]
MRVQSIFRAVFSAFLLVSLCPAAPKNVILFIGDGMGIGQLTAAKYANGGLEMERCTVGGLVTTHCSNDMVTDSAAGGTALSTGHKTSKGTIAQTPDGTPLETVLEVAEDKGKSTGLVVTCGITHATPASFSAHVAKRNMEPQIAEQIAAKDIEVLLGGGRAFFIPRSEKGSKRKDDKDLLAVLKGKMTVVTNETELMKVGTPQRLAGFFAEVAMPKVSEGRISLATMTSKAIEVLAQNKAGFFLMVEGSQIDWGGHANDAGYIVSEMADFDKAVGVGLDFAQKGGDTLVVVTADHETGGFS